MPPWLCHVTAAQIKDSKFSFSRWVQFATIGLNKNPRVRTVVFRGWTDTYEMQIYTDKRSQKCHELNTNNNVEICWLFSHSKTQFRFRGTTRIDEGKDKIKHWNQLSEEHKSMWGWPFPADSFQIESNENISKKVKGNELNNFALLKIKFTQVEQLILQKPIHLRRKWIKKNEWFEERINA